MQPYLFDFYPQFDCVNDQSEDVEFGCIGTVCHVRPFAFGSTLKCVDGEAPRPAMFDRYRRFTEKEWEIIFFTLHGLTAKDVARRLKISNRTVENRLRVIFNKSGTHSARELAMHCRENGTDRYIPPSLLSPSSHVLNNYGAQ
ncbi:MAG: helix-turn-helix transcriptional regulator [Sodalis sp. (in: enterobacteria)]|uniref:helix-turn-helix transcriptional regulator n=1 Tax=Sodalis sp. (in: enterobacteria) TaxID=1898979 RepID=UPI0039E6A59E